MVDFTFISDVYNHTTINGKMYKRLRLFGRENVRYGIIFNEHSSIAKNTYVKLIDCVLIDKSLKINSFETMPYCIESLFDTVYFSNKAKQYIIELHKIIDFIKDESLHEFIKKVFLNANLISKFSVFPASIRSHDSFKHGLIIHTIKTARKALESSLGLSQKEQDFAITGALLHDIGKTKAYTKTGETFVYQYTSKGDMLGHKNLGVELLNEYFQDYNILSLEDQIYLKHIMYTQHIFDFDVKLSKVAAIVKEADEWAAAT